MKKLDQLNNLLEKDPNTDGGMGDEFLRRLKDEWEKYSKEDLQVEDIKGVVYGYGSELATLRVMKAYRENKKVRHGYSENLETFYVSMEI